MSSSIDFENLLKTTVEHNQQARLTGEKYCLMTVLTDLTNDIPIKNIPIEALKPLHDIIKKYRKRLDAVNSELKF